MSLKQRKEPLFSSSLPTAALHTWNECEHKKVGKKKHVPFIIGVAGGTASGKTTVCDSIIKALGVGKNRRVAIISQDSFYNSLSDEEKRNVALGLYNFDHPGCLKKVRTISEVY